MGLINIIKILSNQNRVQESILQNLTPIWGEGTLAPFSQTVSNIQTNTILAATVANTDAYKHHPIITKWNSEYHVAHSQHLNWEDADGQFIQYAYSSNGTSWTADVELLESQCTPALARVKRSCVPAAWCQLGSDLYCVITVSGSADVIANFLGLLAVKVNTNHTFETPFWMTSSPPSAIDGKPTYSVDTTLGNQIIAELQNTNNYPKYAYGADSIFTEQDSTHIEPSGIILPSGYEFILWRKYPGIVNLKDYHYKQSGGSFGTKQESAIIDAPSVTTWKRLNNNDIAMIGNDTDINRTALYYSQSNPYTLNFDTVYNVRTGVSYTISYPGSGKNGGASYVDFIEDNGKIISVYSERKEDIVCSVFDIP